MIGTKAAGHVPRRSVPAAKDDEIAPCQRLGRGARVTCRIRDLKRGKRLDIQIKAHQPVHGQFSRSSLHRRSWRTFGKSGESPPHSLTRAGHGATVQRLGHCAGPVRSFQPDSPAKASDGIDDKTVGQGFSGHSDSSACRFGMIEGIDNPMAPSDNYRTKVRLTHNGCDSRHPQARGSDAQIEQVMIKFYYNAAPNPMKIALFLEESGLDYDPVPIDTRRGEQHEAEFRAINPNGKVPVIVDGGTTVFDSNAILLYLAEKTGKFLPPESSAARGDLLSWLMFVASGVGPFSGQAVHFRNFAPEKVPYAIKRYDFEARRHWQIVDGRLAGCPYMLGGEYSIVDMSVWGWASRLTYMLGDDRIMETYPNVNRLLREIDARPAAQRAQALAECHAFKAEFDEAAMRALYPQIFAPGPG